MQIVVENSALTTGPSESSIDRYFKQSDPQALDSFCQLQAEQLVVHAPISWVQIVYYDPFEKIHRNVVSQAQGTAPLPPETVAYLKSQAWLSDFPLVLTLTEFAFERPASKGYFCPIGYRNSQPEYLLVLASEPLSPVLQAHLIQCAALLKKHSDLYLNFYHQNTETQLLEQIVHRVGHQLRNPLSLIDLYAENLRLGLAPGGLQEQAVVIHETVQSLLTNLTELIYCGRSTQLRRTLQDLHSIVAESIRGLQPWIEEKHIEVVYPAHSVWLLVDRLQMKQVFDNLLSNAIHFSPFAGKITLDWRSFQGEVLIQIADCGKGLSNDDLQKIFMPFYSRRSGGTGLGLTIARKIVLDHQGSLWGQNLPEGGAQFSLTLPRAATREEKC